ncbi:MAG: hypothetical protein KKB50_11600 [Planctomycetes bacterium]|nr:hypothetical protein [Planctomycetota bacterium]
MRYLLLTLMTVLLLVSWGAAQEPDKPAKHEQPKQVKDREAADKPDRQREPALSGPREDHPDRQRPTPRDMPARRAGPRGQGARALPPWEPLIRGVAERRPELARRLKRLQMHDPGRFHDVLMEALMFRLEDVLNEAEEQAGERDGPQHAPPEPGMAPRPEMPEHEREFQRRLDELHQRHQELERRSQELAGHARRLQEREGEPSPEEREHLLNELRQVTNEQFEVRTELRRVELERIERELQHLREMIEQRHHDLERRERERETITERRIRQLIGEELEGW